MSNNIHRDDDATMRAVFEALDGGKARGASGASAARPVDSPPRAAPQLRLITSAAGDAPPKPAKAPVPKRPRAKGGGRSRRPSQADPTCGDAVGAGFGADSGADSTVPAVAPRGGVSADGKADMTGAVRAIVEGAAAGEDKENGVNRAAVAASRRSPGARLAGEWARWRPLRPFLLATLAPVPFLLLAGAAGGIFSLLALLWMTGVLHAIDAILRHRGVEGAAPIHAETADRLSVLLAGVHFALLFYAVWALSGATGLGPLSWVATLLAFGLWFGQVSNSNAHELIHRSDARLFRTGMWVYISLLFGHHASAHRLVHHRFVATADDPNTAAEGEGFWTFAARAWTGALVAGWEMEEQRRARLGTRRGTGRGTGRGAGGVRGMNPYTVYIAGAIGWVSVMVTLFGFDGLLAYLLLCAHTQLQLLLSDYVQHYGLRRRKLPSGALEPAGPEHSWDAPHPFSGMVMLNATRHADHHAHPSRPWPELRLSPQGRAPLLPYSLPVMATIALVPPLWHRMMAPRLAKLRRTA